MERESSDGRNETTSSVDANESLKVAIAMALFRSKLVQNPNHPPPPSTDLPPTSDALKWKRKAKERKQIILRLKEDLKLAEEDGLQYDLFPQTASCKCYFFDDMGKLCLKTFGDNSNLRFNDVLRRRFLRQVRLNERRRRRTEGSTDKRCFSGPNYEDETELLRASVDFLVELYETVSSIQIEDAKRVNWSHQAVDYILASIKNLSFMGKGMESVEGIVNSLIMRLLRRMSAALEGDEVEPIDIAAQDRIQHLIRKLGSEPYVGQRAILSVSQRISDVAESLLFMDPFDDAFPNMHRCMYIMIQLIEFLVSSYLVDWSSADCFDSRLFEEWVASLLHAQKTVKLLEGRNGLYILYMDRVIGEVAKRVGQISSLQKLNADIIDNLFQ